MPKPKEDDTRPCTHPGCKRTQTFFLRVNIAGSQAGIGTPDGMIWAANRQPAWLCDRDRGTMRWSVKKNKTNGGAHAWTDASIEFFSNEEQGLNLASVGELKFLPRVGDTVVLPGQGEGSQSAVYEVIFGADSWK